MAKRFVGDSVDVGLKSGLRWSRQDVCNFSEFGEYLADGEEPGHDAAGGCATEDGDLGDEVLEVAFFLVGEWSRRLGEPAAIGQ
jgi:hypothetical protein